MKNIVQIKVWGVGLILLSTILAGCTNEESASEAGAKIDYVVSQEDNGPPTLGVCDENGCKELTEGEAVNSKTGTNVGEKISFSENGVEFLETQNNSIKFDSVEELISSRNKNTIVWFWSPYCPLCLREVDNIKNYIQENDGEVDIIGVGFSGRGSDRELIEDFIQKSNFPKNSIIQFYDATGKEWKRFGFVSTPSYLFIDSDGTIAGKSNGVLGLSGLEKKNKELFQERAS